MLRLDCPARVDLRIRARVGQEQETLKTLTGKDLKWTFLHDGKEIPFDEVREENGTLVLM